LLNKDLSFLILPTIVWSKDERVLKFTNQ
jgi:hypothetical protein